MADKWDFLKGVAEGGDEGVGGESSDKWDFLKGVAEGGNVLKPQGLHTKKITMAEFLKLGQEANTGVNADDLYGDGLASDLVGSFGAVAPFAVSAGSANSSRVRGQLAQAAKTGEVPFNDVKGADTLGGYVKALLPFTKGVVGKAAEEWDASEGAKYDLYERAAKGERVDASSVAKRVQGKDGRYHAVLDEKGNPMLDERYSGGAAARDAARKEYVKEFSKRMLEQYAVQMEAADEEKALDVSPWYSLLAKYSAEQVSNTANFMGGSAAWLNVGKSGKLGQTVKTIADTVAKGGKASTVAGIPARIAYMAGEATAPALISAADRFERLRADDVAFDENGEMQILDNGMGFGKAAAKSLGGAYGEAITEIALGKAVGGVLGGASKAVMKRFPKVAKAFNEGRLGKAKDAYFDLLKGYENLSRRTKFELPVGEFAEEYVQGILDNVVGLDAKDGERQSFADFNRDFLSWDGNLKELTYGILGMTLGQGSLAHTAAHGKRLVKSFDGRVTGTLKAAGVDDRMMTPSHRIATAIQLNPELNKDLGFTLDELLRMNGVSWKDIGEMSEKEKNAAMSVMEQVYANGGAEALTKRLDKTMQAIVADMDVVSLMDGNWRNVESAKSRKSRTSWVTVADENGNLIWNKDEDGKEYVQDAAVGARIYNNGDGTFRAYHPEIGFTKSFDNMGDATDWISAMDRAAQERTALRDKKKEYVNTIVKRVAPERKGKDGKTYGANVVAFNTLEEALEDGRVPEADRAKIEEMIANGGGATGVKLSDGTVAVFVDNMNTVGGALYTVVHELGHAGLREGTKDNTGGASLEQTIENAWRGTTAKKTEGANAEEKEEDLVYGNERAIAHANPVRRAVAAVKQFVNEHLGGNLELTDADYNAIVESGIRKIEKRGGFEQTASNSFADASELGDVKFVKTDEGNRIEAIRENAQWVSDYRAQREALDRARAEVDALAAKARHDMEDEKEQKRIGEVVAEEDERRRVAEEEEKRRADAEHASVYGRQMVLDALEGWYGTEAVGTKERLAGIGKHATDAEIGEMLDAIEAEMNGEAGALQVAANDVWQRIDNRTEAEDETIPADEKGNRDENALKRRSNARRKAKANVQQSVANAVKAISSRRGMAEAKQGLDDALKQICKRPLMSWDFGDGLNAEPFVLDYVNHYDKAKTTGNRAGNAIQRRKDKLDVQLGMLATAMAEKWSGKPQTTPAVQEVARRIKEVLVENADKRLFAILAERKAHTANAAKRNPNILQQRIQNGKRNLKTMKQRAEEDRRNRVAAYVIARPESTLAFWVDWMGIENSGAERIADILQGDKTYQREGFDQKIEEMADDPGAYVPRDGDGSIDLAGLWKALEVDLAKVDEGVDYSVEEEQERHDAEAEDDERKAEAQALAESEAAAAEARDEYDDARWTADENNVIMGDGTAYSLTPDGDGGWYATDKDSGEVFHVTDDGEEGIGSYEHDAQAAGSHEGDTDDNAGTASGSREEGEGSGAAAEAPSADTVKAELENLLGDEYQRIEDAAKAKGDGGTRWRRATPETESQFDNGILNYAKNKEAANIERAGAVAGGENLTRMFVQRPDAKGIQGAPSEFGGNPEEWDEYSEADKGLFAAAGRAGILRRDADEAARLEAHSALPSGQADFAGGESVVYDDKDGGRVVKSRRFNYTLDEGLRQVAAFNGLLGSLGSTDYTLNAVGTTKRVGAGGYGYATRPAAVLSQRRVQFVPHSHGRAMERVKEHLAQFGKVDDSQRNALKVAGYTILDLNRDNVGIDRNTGKAAVIDAGIVGNGIRWRRSVTPAEDAAYADAVKRGDRETAMRMIREAAAKAMPNAIMDEDGLPKLMSATYDDIGVKSLKAVETAWTAPTLPSKFAKEISSWKEVSVSPYSYSFYNSHEISWNHKPDGSLRVANHWNFTSRGAVHCKTDKPVENNAKWAIGKYDAGSGVYRIIDVADATNDKKDNLTEQYEQARELALDAWREDKRDYKVFFDNGNGSIKSADITYDDAGNLIPLSERFNSEKSDIRWRRSYPSRPDTTKLDELRKDRKNRRDEYFAALDDYSRAKKEYVEAVVDWAKDAPDVLSFITDDGADINLVSKNNADYTDRWRVSYLKTDYPGHEGEHYPIGHTNYKTKEDAVRVAVEDGEHHYEDGARWRRPYRPNAAAQSLADQRAQSLTDALRNAHFGVDDAALFAAEKLQRELSQQGSISPELRDLIERTKQGTAAQRAKGNAAALVSPANLSMLREKLQDSLVSLDEMERRLGVAKGASAYHQFDRNYGMVAKAVDDLDREIITPLAKELKNNDIALDDFSMLLFALHGPERNRMIAERSPYVATALNDPRSAPYVNAILAGVVDVDEAQIDEICKRLGWWDATRKARTKEGVRFAKDLAGSGATTAYWNGKIERFKASGTYDKARNAVALVRELTKRNRDLLVETGRMSAAQRDLWEQLSPNYVPMKSDMEMDANVWSKWLLGGGMERGGGNGKRYSDNEYNHAYGRGTLGDNPLEFAIQQYKESLYRAYDNVARRRLADMVRANPNLGKVFRYLTDTERADLARRISILENTAKSRALSAAEKDALAKMQTALAEANAADTAIPRIKVLGANGIVHEIPDINGLEGTGKVTKSGDGRTSIVAFKENGDLKFVKLGGFEQADINADPTKLDDATAKRIATAVKKQNMAQLNGFGRALRKATGLFSALRTAYAPTFLVSNFGADNTQAARNVYATFGARAVGKFERYAYHSFKAARAVVRGQFDDTQIQRYAKEWYENGGKIGGMATSSIAELTDGLKRTMRKLNSQKQQFMNVNSAKDFIAWATDRKDDFENLAEKMNGVVEMSTRIAAYATARDMGYSIEDAVSYSRDVTVNFNRKGTLSPWLNALYAFSNATMQDLHRSVVAFAEGDYAKGSGVLAKRGAIMGFGLMVMGFIASFLGFWQDDPKDEKEGKAQWKYAKEWQKQNTMGFRVGEKVYGVPIRGISRIPYYLGHQVFEMMAGRKNPVKAAANLLGLAVSSATDFMGQASSLLMTAVPSVLRDPLDIKNNKTFTGRQRYREPLPGHEKTAVRSEMGRKDTSVAAKAVARALNWIGGGDEGKRGELFGISTDVQPEIVQGVWEWIFGSAGKDVSNIVGTVKDAATLNLGNRDLRNIPFFSRFSRKLDENSADYYEARGKYEQAKKHYNSMKEHGRENDAAADVAEHPWLAERGRDSRWGKELKDLDGAVKKLLQIEKAAEPEDYDAIHQLRLKTQYQFMRRLVTPPKYENGIRVDAEYNEEKAHKKVIVPILNKKKNEDRDGRNKSKRIGRRAPGLFHRD